MKKIFLFATACIFTSMFASCNSFGSGSQDDDARLDTVSYVAGITIGRQIESGIMPQLKADHDVIVNTIEKSLKGQESFMVGEVEISKKTLPEIGMKYFGPELGAKVQAAMSDTTGMTEVFDNPTDKEIASTILGVDLSSNLQNAPFDIHTASFIKALKDVHNGVEFMTDEQANDYLNNYFTVVLPAENDRLSKEWLAEIEKEDGVKKTESGLLYKVIEEGDVNAKAVNDEDVVKVLYTGKTRKEKVFDSNRWADMPQNRKDIIMAYQPDMACDNAIEFPLNGVIAGWTEGMKLVGKGGRIHLWIPAELAYGERGAGQNIGPNEALFFDVELLEVTSK